MRWAPKDNAASVLLVFGAFGDELTITVERQGPRPPAGGRFDPFLAGSLWRLIPLPHQEPEALQGVRP